MKRLINSQCGRIGIILLCFYLFANIAMLSFVPVVHPLTLKIHAKDHETLQPIDGVQISWSEGDSSTGTFADAQIGTTQRDGIITIRDAVREQPIWMWPRLGTYSFANKALRFRRKEYSDTVVDLKSLFPCVPYSQSELTGTVLLSKEPIDK